MRRRLNAWIEIGAGRIPLLLTPRDQKRAKDLFPEDLLRTLVEPSSPPWRAPLEQRPRGGWSPSLGALPEDAFLREALRGFVPEGPPEPDAPAG